MDEKTDAVEDTASLLGGHATAPIKEKTDEEKMAEIKKIVEDLEKSPAQKYLTNHISLLRSFLETPHPAVFVGMTNFIQDNAKYRPGETYLDRQRYEQLRNAMDKILQEEGGMNIEVKHTLIDAVYTQASLLKEAVVMGKKDKEIFDYFDRKGSGGYAKTAVLLTTPGYAGKAGLPSEINFVNALKQQHGGKLHQAVVNSMPRM